MPRQSSAASECRGQSASAGPETSGQRHGARTAPKPVRLCQARTARSVAQAPCHKCCQRMPALGRAQRLVWLRLPGHHRTKRPWRRCCKGESPSASSTSTGSVTGFLRAPWKHGLALAARMIDERSTQVLLLWGSLCLGQRRARGTIGEAVSRSRDDLRAAEWMAKRTSGQERKARRGAADAVRKAAARNVLGSGCASPDLRARSA